MKSNAMLEAALEYASGGKCVFPCGLDKRPLVKGGFKAASHNKVQIREWWKRWPEAMIGMPTGRLSGLLAVDCDGDDGVSNFLDICASDGFEPDTSWQSTPSGGRHYFFNMPEADIHCSVGKLALHVDIRATGGYIICAPSRREDGKTYEWQKNDKISPLPETLLDRLLNLKNIPAVPTPERKSSPDGSQLAYCRKALVEELAKVKNAAEGERNQILNSAAFALGQLVGSSLLDEGLVESELLSAAQLCGLPDREAIRTIRSGMKAGILEPRIIPAKPAIAKAFRPSIVQANNEWPEPVHFATFNLPKLTREMLPNPLGDYCAALSEEKQTPLELAACMSLVALATAAQSRFRAV